MKKNIADILYFLACGGLGGTVHYLHDIMRKDLKFSWKLFVINVVISGFVAVLVGVSLPETLMLRDLFVGIAAISAIKIVEVIEYKGSKIIFKLFKLDNGKNKKS